MLSQCDASLGLSYLNQLVPDSAITASKDLSTNHNQTNNKPYYARLNGNNAFCHIVENDFYVQVDFGKRKTISGGKVQLWSDDASSVPFLGFALSFSLNGGSWFVYNGLQNLGSRMVRFAMEYFIGVYFTGPGNDCIFRYAICSELITMC